MIKTNAVFFDGVSSVPQPLELELNDVVGQIVFEFPIGEVQTWALIDSSIESVGSVLMIRNKTTLGQYFKIQDQAFISALNMYLKSNGHLSSYQKLINLGIRTHIALALMILGCIVLIYLFIIPWVGEKSVGLIPLKYDQEMGSNFYKQYCNYNTIDTLKTKELNQFAHQLDLKNTKELNFTVIKSNTINAFALPDGHIIVFTGIIDQMMDYSELVALIGHEVIHVNHRHSMKMICRNLSGYIFISAVLSDINGIMAIIGDNVRNLQELSYSRQFEMDAEEEGVKLMIDNKVNPKGRVNLFSRLQSTDVLTIPEFLSSHPVTKERLNGINKLIKSNSFPMAEKKGLKEMFEKIKQ
jgi:predicted Zn-dependent protease